MNIDVRIHVREILELYYIINMQTRFEEIITSQHIWLCLLKVYVFVFLLNVEYQLYKIHWLITGEIQCSTNENLTYMYRLVFEIRQNHEIRFLRTFKFFP